MIWPASTSSLPQFTFFVLLPCFIKCNKLKCRFHQAFFLFLHHLPFPFRVRQQSTDLQNKRMQIKIKLAGIPWLPIEVKTVSTCHRWFCPAVSSTDAGGNTSGRRGKVSQERTWRVPAPCLCLVSGLLLWFLTCCKQLLGCVFDLRSSAVLQLCCECQTPSHFTSSVSRGLLSHLWEFDQIPAWSWWPDYYWSANPCFVHPVWGAAARLFFCSLLFLLCFWQN